MSMTPEAALAEFLINEPRIAKFLNELKTADLKRVRARSTAINKSAVDPRGIDEIAAEAEKSALSQVYLEVLHLLMSRHQRAREASARVWAPNGVEKTS